MPGAERGERTVNRMERMVALHRVLDSRRHPASMDELMTELECSRSTLFRTIRHLRDHLSAPIENAPGRGYFYDRGAGRFELPGLWFRSDELEALLVMDELLSRVQPGLLKDLIAPLRSRFQAILDQGSRGSPPFPAHRFRILRAHGRDVGVSVFETAATAVVERRRLAFTYEARSTAETARRATSPQRLVYYRDQWYLDCWDEDRQSLRTFALDRMTSTEVLDQPARDVSTEELSETFGAGYGLFSGPVRGRARLRFVAERAPVGRGRALAWTAGDATSAGRAPRVDRAVLGSRRAVGRDPPVRSGRGGGGTAGVRGVGAGAAGVGGGAVRQVGVEQTGVAERSGQPACHVRAMRTGANDVPGSSAAGVRF